MSEKQAEQTGDSGGGTITAAVAYETDNYHPSSTSSALALGANWHVMEGLYELDMHDAKPYKALAADDDLTKISDTQYEVKLRDGAKFSDGTAVTTEDVATSFDRATAEGNLYVPMLSFIKDVTAKDDKTVSIELNHPFSLVKERLPLVKIVPSKASDDDLTAKPIGTGPWKYDTIDQQQIVFSPNENYNGDHPAKAKKMEWSILKDDTARATAMQEGSVQVMESVPANIEAQLTSAGATVDKVQGFNLPFLMFNTKKAPFTDHRVRQAFFYAIDTQKLIDNALSGQAEPATSFLPKNHPNYNQASTVYTHNPDRAKQLLAEAGQSSLKINLQTTDHPWVTSLAPQIKNDLAAIGIEAEINSEATASLFANTTDVDNPSFDVVLAPGDPSVFGSDPDLLMNWWYGDNTWTNKRTQWKGSPEFDQLQQLLSEAARADGDAQQQKWNECFNLLSEQVPLYPLFHRQVATGYYADKLTGYTPIGTTGLNFIDVSVK